MAKSKNNNASGTSSSSASSKKPSLRVRIAHICTDERTVFITGLLILLFACFSALAFISFFFTGQADQSLLENQSFLTLSKVNNQIANWMGSLGAYLSEIFINRWIGISAFFFVYFLFRLGLKMMKLDTIESLSKLLIRCMLWGVWFSLAFGFFFISSYGDSFLYLGGKHGYDLTLLLKANIGWGGTFILILGSFIILSIFVFDSTIDKVRSLFKLPSKIREEQKEKSAARAAAREEQRLADEARNKEEMALAATASVANSNVSASNACANNDSTSDNNASPIENYESTDFGENVNNYDDDLMDPSITSPETYAEQTETNGSYTTQIEENIDNERNEFASIETKDLRNEDNSFLNDGMIEDDEKFNDDESIELEEEDQFINNESSIDEEDKFNNDGSIENDNSVQNATPSSNDNFTVKTHNVETVSEPVEHLENYDPTLELSHYNFPTFELLKQYKDKDLPIDMDEQNANKEKIKSTLQDYGIEIQSISATVGPTITLFEIVPVQGTRIAKIRGLQDEIAMSIAAVTGIRIIAPIPGKTAIGIEVPNKDPQIVSMHSVITSRAFQETKFELPIALGKTITNEVFTFDLAKMPHLLVAGATGQGKSVGLNAIITSLLYKKHPSQLKFVLIDPKQVEFSIYSRIEKHFLAKLPEEEEPIITDVTKVVATLNSVCVEMENRYALLKDAGLRNIKEYNEKFIHRELNPRKGHHYLPYIVVIVDEYGDLIMTAGKEIELPIARIAQKARAVGIHMIIATQRPSAKIITGIIKANFPARMAFRVGQSIDSSIILDQPGAQHLIGRGDLLFSTGNNLTRVQCAFVDTPEVNNINLFIADQQSYPTAFLLPEPPASEGGSDGSNSGDVDLNHLDPLFNEVAELVVGNQQGSTSMIQRKFSIGYNRAGRIMDQLEAAGIVGPYEGSKARSVLVGDDIELEQVLSNLRNK